MRGSEGWAENGDARERGMRAERGAGGGGVGETRREGAARGVGQAGSFSTAQAGRDNKRRRPRSPAGTAGVSKGPRPPPLPTAGFLFGVFGTSGCWEEAVGEGSGVGGDAAVPRFPLSVCDTHYSEGFPRWELNAGVVLRLHGPVQGCIITHCPPAAGQELRGLRVPLLLFLWRQLSGIRASGGSVCALAVLHVSVSSVVFVQEVLLAGTLQRDTGTEAEKFYHLVGTTHRLLKMAKKRIIFKCNTISLPFSL